MRPSSWKRFSKISGISSISGGFFKFYRYLFLLFLKTKSTVLSKYLVLVLYLVLLRLVALDLKLFTGSRLYDTKNT
jgi:hypothetical protein